MPADAPTPRETRKEREFRSHRREILRAAVQLFAEHGYHQTTMQMIAERADFSVGYLYKHFPGKEEMYAEMLERHMGRIDDLVAGVESLGLKPLDELRRVLEIVCEHFNEHRDFMRIYHLDMTEAFDALVERKRMHHEKTVVLLERAREAGSWRTWTSNCSPPSWTGPSASSSIIWPRRPTRPPSRTSRPRSSP